MSEDQDAPDSQPAEITDRLETLAERVDRLEARSDLETTGPDGSRISLEQLLALGLTRRQAIAALGFVAAGATSAGAIGRSLETVQSDDDTDNGANNTDDRLDLRSANAREVNKILFAHEYDSAQDAVDAAEDGSTVVFLSAYDPYEEFIVPPRDNLTLKSDGALVETSLETGSKRYNEIIANPTAHPEYESGEELGSTTDVVTEDIAIGDERIEVADASIFDTGDIVFLHDEADEWIAYPDLEQNPPLRAEFLEVRGVNESDNELFFEGGATLEFTNDDLKVSTFNPLCSRLIVDGFHLSGAYDEGSDFEERGIALDYCSDLTIRNISTVDVGRLSVGARNCYRVYVENIDMRNSGRYGVQAAGASKNVKISNVYAARMRYATQFISYVYGPTNNVMVSNAVAEGCNQGFNVHPGAYRVSFYDCDTVNSGGYRIRSPKTTVRGGHINTGGNGAFVLSHRFSDTRISNVQISEINDSGVARLEPSVELKGLVFDNIMVSTDSFVGSTAFAISDGDSGATIEDMTITNCRFPNIERYHSIIGGSTAEFTGEITVDSCYIRGNRAIIECRADEENGADEALFIVRNCTQRGLDSSDAFRDHEHEDRLIVVDNDFVDGPIDEVDEALVWDGNREINTS